MVAPALLWFRDDLRLSDHPALEAALQSGAPLFCIYIHDESGAGGRRLGGAARWWLAQSLRALAADLASRGGRLDLLVGNAERKIPELVRALGAGRVFWSRRYAEGERTLDAGLKARLVEEGVEVESFNARLLIEPWRTATAAGSPYRVFTPFSRALRQALPPAFSPPTPAPQNVPAAPWPKAAPERVEVSSFATLPAEPIWWSEFETTWRPGEIGAAEAVKTFIVKGLRGYAENRNVPSLPAVSRLSPHLRFGEIGPHALFYEIAKLRERASDCGEDCAKFESELLWREFAYHLLYHFPHLTERSLQTRFEAFPWRSDAAAFRAWTKGRTGYPIVDAGMRELWATGYLHNRVRMIVASFLIKHLLLDWREGERWFWDTLCDADPASNPVSWQWVAGSGADAAPYFRIFNPVIQGEKFDQDGSYVRRWVGELERMPAKYVHRPWEAPADILKQAGVKLGSNYPHPIVDHAFARARALAALATLI